MPLGTYIDIGAVHHQQRNYLSKNRPYKIVLGMYKSGYERWMVLGGAVLHGLSIEVSSEEVKERTWRKPTSLHLS